MVCSLHCYLRRWKIILVWKVWFIQARVDKFFYFRGLGEKAKSALSIRCKKKFFFLQKMLEISIRNNFIYSTLWWESVPGWSTIDYSCLLIANQVRYWDASFTLFDPVTETTLRPYTKQKTENIKPFTGKLGQRYLIKTFGSCSSKLDGEIIPLSYWIWP